MDSLATLIVGGLLMSAVAMVGGVTTLLAPATLERIVLPLVALAAGTLLGGAFFHMVPEGMQSLDPLDGAAWLTCGFATFLAFEQFLHWHHGHGAAVHGSEPARGACRLREVTWLVLLGDGLHNLVGGLAIGSTYLLDARAGVVAFLAGVAHEIPQELGDFGVLVHGGWTPRRALVANLLSALTFPVGALTAYSLAQRFDVAGLALFGAGNFIYIAASDLIPEIKAHTSARAATLHFACFAAGLALLYGVALVMRGS